MTGARHIQIERIFISRGHNFFGHQGQPAGAFPVIEVGEVECVPGQGLAGDRFFGFKKNYKGKVTFFAAEVFDDVCRQLGVGGKLAGVTRRNVITRGVDLNVLIGKQFEVQGILFEGVSELQPLPLDERRHCARRRSGVARPWRPPRPGAYGRHAARGHLRGEPKRQADDSRGPGRAPVYPAPGATDAES